MAGSNWFRIDEYLAGSDQFGHGASSGLGYLVHWAASDASPCGLMDPKDLDLERRSRHSCPFLAVAENFVLSAADRLIN